MWNNGIWNNGERGFIFLLVNEEKVSTDSVLFFFSHVFGKTIVCREKKGDNSVILFLSGSRRQTASVSKYYK